MATSVTIYENFQNGRSNGQTEWNLGTKSVIYPISFLFDFLLFYTEYLLSFFQYWGFLAPPPPLINLHLLVMEQTMQGGEALGPKLILAFRKFLKFLKFITLEPKQMSDHIPFEIQSDIIKKLPVKSLLQFRSVSKQWKSFIDSPKIINNYHINHTNPQHHLLVSCELDTVQTYTSIIDNNTFPQQKLLLTAPESVSLLRDTLTLGSVNGLLCFYGFYGDVDSKTNMAVMWNPAVRKSVGIVVIPKGGCARTIVGFGVCPESSDPKLVKITVAKLPIAKLPEMWEVQVFTLSTRLWKTVYMDVPFKSCHLTKLQVFVNGVIYYIAQGSNFVNDVRSRIIISFDLKSEKLGEVCLPETLVHAPHLEVMMVNESLGLLEYYFESEMSVCGVWTRKDGSNKPFTKIYTVKVEGKSMYDKVLGFRNNGEVVMEIDDDDYLKYGIKVYEPLSGKINGIGITGYRGTFSVKSYMETLLLLDQSDSIIR